MPSVAGGIMSLMTGTESVQPHPLLVCPLWLKMQPPSSLLWLSAAMPPPVMDSPGTLSSWSCLLSRVLSQQPKITDTNVEQKPWLCLWLTDTWQVRRTRVGGPFCAEYTQSWWVEHRKCTQPLHHWRCSPLSLFTGVTIYMVTMNAELASTNLLFPEKYKVKFLEISVHNSLSNWWDIPNNCGLPLYILLSKD